MTEQKNVHGQTQPPESKAMSDFLDAISHPPSLPGAPRKRRLASRSNTIAGVGLGFGIGGAICLVLLFTPLGCFAVVAVMVLSFIGAICSVMGLQQARVCRSGRGIALAGLIVSSIPILLTMLFWLLLRLSALRI